MSRPIFNDLLNSANRVKPLLSGIIRHMYKNPELSLQEEETSRFLSTLLEDEGFRVTRPLADLPTAFVAEKRRGRKKPAVAYLAEMDALPGIGHACGHNVIAAASVGAALLLRDLVEERNAPGRILVIGTPAEEKGIGKVKMLDAGLFDGVDAAMMVHPSSRRIVDKGYLALRRLRFTFRGKAAHAAAYPEKGVNALDAMILFFSSVGLARQQMPDSVKVHGIITDGGQAPNIIPEKTEAYFYLRSNRVDDLEELTEKVVRCAKGAAKGTGCRVFIREESYTLHPMKINGVLAETYREGMRHLGLSEDDAPRDRNLGSSDIGNVSLRVPTIQPLVPISRGEKIEIHTRKFRDATVSERGLEGALEGAILLAYTGYRFLTDGKLRRRVRRDHLAAE